MLRVAFSFNGLLDLAQFHDESYIMWAARLLEESETPPRLALLIQPKSGDRGVQQINCFRQLVGDICATTRLQTFTWFSFSLHSI